MLKYTNKGTVDEIKRYFEENGITVELLPRKQGFLPQWKLTDKNGTVCRVVFQNSVGSYDICTCNEVQKNMFFPAIIQVYIQEDSIIVYKAYTENKVWKADRHLRKYEQLARLVSCCNKLNLLKI